MDEKEKQELLEKVEAAAEKGAKKGSKIFGIPTLVVSALVIALIAAFVIPKVNNVSSKFNTIFYVDEAVEGHDLTITNHGIFGYKTADFADVILGDASKLKKVEVYSQDMTLVTTITDTGLFNWSALTKTRVITYEGTVVYTVDLSKLSADSFVFDAEKMTLTMSIPHAVQEEINIPEDKIQFADTEKGLLAFGELKPSMEQGIEIQKRVRADMTEKLKNDNIGEKADSLAKFVIWSMYSPMVKTVAGNASLEVVIGE